MARRKKQRGMTFADARLYYMVFYFCRLTCGFSLARLGIFRSRMIPWVADQVRCLTATCHLGTEIPTYIFITMEHGRERVWYGVHKVPLALYVRSSDYMGAALNWRGGPMGWMQRGHVSSW